MISNESAIIQRLSFFDMMMANDIKCYDDVTITEGLRDFNPKSGTIINTVLPPIKDSKN